MAQLFGPRADRRLRLFAAAAVLLVLLAAGFGYYRVRSAAYWDVGKPPEQPIAFPHDRHAGLIGLDCRYCHGTAQFARQAGMPAVQTCLTCHAEIWRGVPSLEPLHRAARLGKPIVWRPVSQLPAFARFHHGVHIEAGVGCERCHGDVATMERTAKATTLSMGFCLECHHTAQGEGSALLKRSSVRDLSDCSVCHY